MDGIRLNPRTLSTMLAIPPGTSASDVIPEPWRSARKRSRSRSWSEWLRTIYQAGPIQFLLTVIDTATGRELQDRRSAI